MDLEDDHPRTAQTQPTEFSSPSETSMLPTNMSSPAANEHTPYSKTENSSGHYASESLKSKEIHRRLGHEAAKICLGPMPVGGAEGGNFFDEFLPLPSEVKATMPQFPKNAFNSVPEVIQDKMDLYEPIVSAFNARTSIFRAVRTDEISEGGSTTGSSKPDISIYPGGLDQAYTRDGKCFAHFGYLGYFMEIKQSKRDDCFSDDQRDLINFEYSSNSSSFGETGLRGLETLGRSAYYATQIFSRQHRQCVFSMMVFGLWVRLLRWDRAGVLVTKAFNLHEEPELLCEFIWRLERVDLETRGYDTTVAQDTEQQDKNQFGTIVRERLQFELGTDTQDTNRAINRHYDPDNLSIATVTDSSGITRNYCISKPTCTPLSPPGRGTRGYLAYGLDSKEVRFVKDTWCKNVEGAELEGDITRKLFEDKVQNVPEIECHGKVPRSTRGYDWQETLTQKFITAPWVRRSLPQDELRQLIVGHTHYRMVSKTVGCSLDEHADAKELLNAARDVFNAVQSAYTRSKRLHRDISANNIILVRNRETGKRTAYLIDWEFSVKHDDKPVKRCYMITGTWQFISHRLLQGEDKSPHRLSDDIESILWVTHWHLLVYYADLSTKSTGMELRRLFDEFEIDSGRLIGGNSKQLRLLRARENIPVLGFSAYPVIGEWLTEYARRIYSLQLSPPQDIRPHLDTLRSTIFDLADKVPDQVIKKLPDWEGLKTHRRPQLSLSESANISTNFIRGLGMRTVSHGTVPAPSTFGQLTSIGALDGGGTEVAGGSGGGVVQQTGGRARLDENSDEEGRGAKRVRVDHPS